MPQGRPMPGEIYRHFKGKTYQIITTAVHSETGEELVIYQALYGSFRIYARPYAMFVSEVDREKYPEAKQAERFQYLAEAGEYVPDAQEEEKELTEEQPEQKGAPPHESAPQKPRETACEAQEAEPADPRLIRFMDAASFSEKFEIFSAMRPQITDKLIDEIALACDLVIPEGETEERFEQLKKCLQTRMKYERERNWEAQ